MPVMVRGFLGLILAGLLAAVPVVRNVCDLACLPAAATAAVPPASHCAVLPADPEPVPSPAPLDRCGHDHHALRFVSAAPSALAAPDLAFTAPHLQSVIAPLSSATAVAPAARGGPSHAGRAPLNLRI